MLQEYYKEEYKGENNKSIIETTKRVQNFINSEAIYVLKSSSGEILSFCTIINPDLGILFTKTPYRRQGKGKKLLSFCSSLLLNENDKIYLMTLENVTSSNATSKSVGFIPFFDFTYIRINNG